ncbi:MAG TPA: SUF system Fe-S cluster assembly regulator [Planctomycetota bacterium]|nr:SUF system Fe-S cluster assembly regulator [Planctomycetota bacterium]
MIRLTRLTDYGIMLLTIIARERNGATRSARELAARSRLPQPTVSKLLKALAHGGLLETRRGVRGGFTLAKPAEQVTVADIIAALEGPIGITECTAHPGQCGVEPMCPVRTNWRKINRAVLEALRGISLAEMARPISFDAKPVELRRSAGNGG